MEPRLAAALPLILALSGCSRDRTDPADRIVEFGTADLGVRIRNYRDLSIVLPEVVALSAAPFANPAPEARGAR